MVEISDVSTDMRSLRSKRVGPLTESEIPIEKKENQSRKVRHRAGHGYDGASISIQFKESLETVTQRQGLVSSGGEYKEQMRGSQLTKKERDNALHTMWTISCPYSCCQPECRACIKVPNCRLCLHADQTD